ncbi:MAG: hypothetical protein EHM45_14385 [Desulfobacteraceae bacterium]|nr:MAG: hypothetical protein EHM45_14385 [Desulfobacteraceae bacterium]
MYSKEWHQTRRARLCDDELARRTNILNEMNNGGLAAQRMSGSIDKLIQFYGTLSYEKPPLELIYGHQADMILDKYQLGEGGLFALTNSPDRIEKCIICIGLRHGLAYVLSSLVHEYYHYVQVQKIGAIYLRMPDTTREFLCNKWANEVFLKYLKFGDTAIMYYILNAKSFYNPDEVKNDRTVLQ